MTTERFYRNAFLNPNIEIRNSKWFESLTTLSQVEGQYQMTKIQMT
jgi:hypothetical protein